MLKYGPPSTSENSFVNGFHRKKIDTGNQSKIFTLIREKENQPAKCADSLFCYFIVIFMFLIKNRECPQLCLSFVPSRFVSARVG